MKALKMFIGLVVLVAAFAVPPAMIGSVMTAAAGVAMFASATLSSAVFMAPAPAVSAEQYAVAPVESVKVVQLPRGLVVFHQVDGRLVSNFIRT